MTNLADKLSQSLSQIQVQRASSQGVLTRVVGLTLEATGVNAPVGSYCDIISPSGSTLVAEVVGFGDGKLLLMPFGSVQGIAAGFKVKPQSQTQSTAMSRSMLGRVLDGMGQPLDGGPDIVAEEHRSILGQSINPLKRRPIDQALDVGVRSINALLTVGCGQRLGLMAGSGVGKSVLMGMMTRFTQAEVIVIGLIGEREEKFKNLCSIPWEKPGLPVLWSLRLLETRLQSHAYMRLDWPPPSPSFLGIKANLFCYLWILFLVWPKPNEKLAWPLANHLQPKATLPQCLPSFQT